MKKVISVFVVMGVMVFVSPVTNGAKGGGKPGAPISVWESEQVVTDNNGATKRVLLGTKLNVQFCALSFSKFYRHGDPNRGGLECHVYVEGENWYLAASGPTHNRGTSNGAASAGCRAMCFGSP